MGDLEQETQAIRAVCGQRGDHAAQHQILADQRFGQGIGQPQARAPSRHTEAHEHTGSQQGHEHAGTDEARRPCRPRCRSGFTRWRATSAEPAKQAQPQAAQRRGDGPPARPQSGLAQVQGHPQQPAQPRRGQAKKDPGIRRQGSGGRQAGPV